MKAQRSITITGLLLREAPRVQPVYNRPFNMELLDTTELNNIADMANSSPSAITPFDAAKAAPGLISLGSPTRLSDIPNGYNQKRYSFTLNALIVYMDGTKRGITIEGYTDNDDIQTYTKQTFNPKQRLYMVSVKTVKLASSVTNGTYGMLENVSNIILPDVVRQTQDTVDLTGLSALDTIATTWTTQAPNDMFTDMLVDEPNEQGISSLNLSNALVGTSTSVNVKASSPFGFSSTVINSYQQAMQDIELDSDTAMGDLATNLYSSCHSRSTDTELATNDLIMALRRTSDGPIKGFFTMQDLQKVDPTFTDDRITAYTLDTKTDIMDWTNYAADDFIVSTESDIASLTGTLINNFMQRADANIANIVISNRSTDIAVPFIVQVVSCDTLQKGRGAAVSRALEKMVRDELCPLIVARYPCSFMIKVTARNSMESKVEVSVDGGAPLTKVLPTYANTVYSPVLVPPGIETGMSSGFSTIVDILGSSSDGSPLSNDVGLLEHVEIY